jgi:hypothetical protein
MTSHHISTGKDKASMQKCSPKPKPPYSPGRRINASHSESDPLCRQRKPLIDSNRAPRHTTNPKRVFVIDSPPLHLPLPASAGKPTHFNSLVDS